MIGTTGDTINTLETMNTADAFDIAAQELRELHALLEQHRPGWYTLNYHLSIDTTVALLESHITMERDGTFAAIDAQCWRDAWLNKIVDDLPSYGEAKMIVDFVEARP
jgi:hypothetical protein